ncbi:hypothetical protein YYC_05364 [Plasmodium yoelii 17X]|uniref:Uncharacterized protein n=1 Tax=Plasmodium yoelii 17X TaxID=1323249 RepID=V7PAX2_PLAYE|nr:hypothetical protein YYC_05364 [Plasmodium yoelii 17X]
MMWLGYKLNQKLKNEFPNINEFYNKHMKDYHGYKKKIDYVDDYSSYNDLINKKTYLLTMSIKDISKFYEVFKSLCKLYTECDNSDSDYNSYLENTQEFVKKYEQLKKDLNISEDSPYYQLFSILSKDYDNFKNKCSYFPPLLTYSLISIAFIFVAIPIFFGISYKRKNKKYNEENDSLIYNSKINND